MTDKKICTVIGVGPDNGAALGRRFAREGYAVALLARTTQSSAPLAAAGGRPRRGRFHDATNFWGISA